MILTIQVQNWKGQQHKLTIDTDPDTCPICHRGIEPVDQKWDFLIADPCKPVIERVLRCPKKDCQRLFIARYIQKNIAASVLFELDTCVPAELHNFDCAPELRTISPDFCDIYNQAHKAEQLGLLLVCGPGYRKALEFLIKDYVSLLNPTEDAKKEIEDLPLMGCMKKYVTDGKIKITAERATWLGNDETHYIRKWEDKDLQDMKRFIQLTCYWIQSEQLTSDAVVDMPQGKK